jgi:hypothetical protein
LAAPNGADRAPSVLLRHRRIGQHRFGGHHPLLRPARDRLGEFIGRRAVLAADRLQLGEVAARLLDRALLDQRLALARERGKVGRIALERVAVILDRLALQPVGARRGGEVQEDRRVGRVDRQRGLERIDRLFALPGGERGLPWRISSAARGSGALSCPCPMLAVIANSSARAAAAGAKRMRNSLAAGVRVSSGTAMIGSVITRGLDVR